MLKRITAYLQKNIPLLLPGAAALCSLGLFIWAPTMLDAEESWARSIRSLIEPSGGWNAFVNSFHYMYKPAASLWFSFCAFIAFGAKGLWSIRILEVFSAVVLLYSVIYIGKSLFDRKTGLTAGWITLSTYPFLLLGRTAGADMFSCAAVMFTVAWAEAHRQETAFRQYLIFYLLCFFCIMAKGLPFLGVSFIAAVFLLALRDDLRRHLNFKNLAAFFAGCGSFLLLSACVYYYQVKAEGADWNHWIYSFLHDYIYMLWDSTLYNEPWYFYIQEFLRLTFPWTLIIVIAFFEALLRFRKVSAAVKALWGISFLCFVVFSATAAKEWYYIACIMPFFSLLAAQWLCRDEKKHWEALFVNILYYLVTGIASAGVLAVIILPVMASRLAVELPGILIAAPAFAGFTVLVIAIAAESENISDWFSRCAGLPTRLAVTLTGAALLCGIIMACCLPAVDFFRYTRDFVRNELVPAADELPDTNIILLAKQPRGDIIYYLDRDEVVPHFSVWNKAGEPEPELCRVFVDYIKWRRSGAVMIISDDESVADLAVLAEEIPEWDIQSPRWQEADFDSEAKNKRKIVAWILQ